MIAFSAAYLVEPDHIYLMDDNGGNLSCLTSQYTLPSYREIWWLPNQQQFLCASFAPYMRYYTIDRTGEQLRLFLPEFEPKMIRQITASGHIVFDARGKDWIVPAHRPQHCTLRNACGRSSVKPSPTRGVPHSTRCKTNSLSAASNAHGKRH